MFDFTSCYHGPIGRLRPGDIVGSHIDDELFLIVSQEHKSWWTVVCIASCEPARRGRYYGMGPESVYWHVIVNR